MIKLLAKKDTVFCLLTTLLLSHAEIANCIEIVNFSNSSHQYSSYSEFAASVCLPCHYRNIPNGTDLQKLFPDPSEAELKRFLLPILKDGNMPPNKLYRKIIYNKFLQIK